jgi:hypothetical protein
MRIASSAGAKRLGSMVMALLPAACDGAITSLVVDVRRSDDAITILADEPERACECSFGFPSPGSCRASSDALECACDPWPADCLESVAIREGDDVVASTRWREESSTGASLLAEQTGDVELEIRGCGGEARIPIPQEPRPHPTIEATAVEGEPNAQLLTWTSDIPAATQLISLGDGYVGETCHESGDSGTRQVEADSEDVHFRVTALAPVVEHEVAFGTIRVWSGNSALFTLSP